VARGTTVEVDVGTIAGRPFLNTASLGAYVDLVDVRERLEGRIGKWPAAIVALLVVLWRSSPVDVELDGRRRRVWLMFVGNCRYQPDGFAPTRRDRLDDGALDIRVVEHAHPFSRTRLMVAALSGRLRRCRAYDAWSAPALRVRSLQGPLRLARDGETFDGPPEFVVGKADRRLRVFAAM
jgi:undecaprenyl-diphosphatase